MFKLQKFALLIFSLTALQQLYMGGLYLSAAEFMPYHAQALQTEWSELNSNYQGLILGYMKGMGAGALVVGLASGFMVLRYWQSVLLITQSSLEPSQDSVKAISSVEIISILLPLLSLAYNVLLNYASYYVSVTTPGQPSVNVMTVMTVLLLSASLVLWRSKPK